MHQDLLDGPFPVTAGHSFKPFRAVQGGHGVKSGAIRKPRQCACDRVANMCLLGSFEARRVLHHIRVTLLRVVEGPVSAVAGTQVRERIEEHGETAFESQFGRFRVALFGNRARFVLVSSNGRAIPSSYPTVQGRLVAGLR